MRRIGKIALKIAQTSYIIGSTSLILGFILSFVHMPVSASAGIEGGLSQNIKYQPSACTLAYKCESPGCEPDPDSSWNAPGGYQICQIAIKAGPWFLPFNSNGCVDISPPPNGDGNPDYCVSGIGTGVGEAERVCVENGQTQCYAISHSEYYIDVLPPTPTSTGVLPSPTPTETNMSPSPTPTDTNVPPSQTPTNTDIPPSLTPTGTSVPPTSTQTATHTGTPIASTLTPTATPTEQPTDTNIPTITQTDLPPSSTPTATILATLTTPTVTQSPPSGENQTPTFTSTISSELVSPTATQSLEETPATLPPPQPSGTQTAMLVPVTGMDFSSPLVELERIQRSLMNFGLALLGMGLLFQGIGKKIEEN